MTARTTRPSSYAARLRVSAALAAVVVAGTTGAGAAAASEGPTEGADTAAAQPAAVAPGQPADESANEPASEPDPEPVVEPDPEPDAEPVVEPDAEPVEAPAVEPDAGPAAGPAAAPAPATEPTSESQPVGSGQPQQTTVAAGASDEEVAAATPSNALVSYADGVVTLSWTPDPSSFDYHVMINGVDEHLGNPMSGGASFPLVLAPGSYAVALYDAFSFGGPMTNLTLVVSIVAPSEPTSLAAQQQGPGSATVTWAAPANDGGTPVTGYTVTVDGGTPVDVPADATSHTLSGLVRGSHAIAVHATNAEGDSLDATTSVAIAEAPAAPTVDAVQSGPGTVDVDWTPSDDGGSPVTAYTVSVDGGTPATVDASTLSTRLTGVAAGARTVTVTATNAVGDSEAGTATVDVIAAPSAPQNLVVDVDEVHATALVTWAAPAAPGYPDIAGYAVELDGELVDDVSADTSTSVLEDLEVGEHTVVVLAYSDEADGAEASFTFQVEEAPVPAPTGVTAQQDGPGAVTVTWTDTSGDTRITGYRVTGTVAVPGVLGAGWQETAGAGQVTVDVAAGARQTRLTGLSSGVAYTFTVQPLTGNGVGSVGTTTSTTRDWRTPSVSQGVSVEQTGPGQITVRWSAPADEGTSVISRYVVGLSSDQAGGYEEFDPDTREVVVDDVDPGTYDVRLTAVNAEGAGTPVDLQVVVRAGSTVGVGGPATATPVVQGRPLATDLAQAGAGAAQAGALARTGSESGTVALGGSLLLALGGVLMTAGRRRRRSA